MAIHLGWPFPTISRDRPEVPLENKRHAPPIWSCSRWGLPCRTCCHVRGALLPHPFTLTSKRRFAFCGTFPGVTSAGRYPAPCSHGARTFLCPKTAAIRSSDTAKLVVLGGLVNSTQQGVENGGSFSIKDSIDIRLSKMPLKSDDNILGLGIPFTGLIQSVPKVRQALLNFRNL